MTKFNFKVGEVYKTSKGYSLVCIYNEGLGVFYNTLGDGPIEVFFFTDGQPFGSAAIYGYIVDEYKDIDGNI
jgi:hypothetical protein